MFSMISSSGQKMIDYIDMQIGNRGQHTIDTKDVSKNIEIIQCTLYTKILCIPPADGLEN